MARWVRFSRTVLVPTILLAQRTHYPHDAVSPKLLCGEIHLSSG